MEFTELNPELFSYELYNMAGCFQIDTALYCAESFGYCDALKEVIFKGRTLEEVKQMKKYPFGIGDESIIKFS